MTRIICCGNPDRGDDGVGLVVAARLQEFGIPAQTCSGETTELLEAWKWAADVIVVDAVVTGAPAGSLHYWEATELKLPGRGAPFTHGFGLGEAIRLARTLNSLPVRLRVYGIEANQFEPGMDISAEVRGAAEALASKIAGEVAV